MALTWARRKQAIVIGGFSAAGLVLLSGIAFAIFYKVPTCTDGSQNGDETGIDCGGSCEHLCRADVQAPNVSSLPAFARAIAYSGRTDVVAYVENRNPHAEAKDARYTVEAYDAEGRLLGSSQGVVDLPARSVAPIFVPNVVMGVGTAARAFVEIDADTKWRAPRGGDDALSLGTPELVLGPAPRVRVAVENRSASTLPGRELVAVVRDASGEVLAASQTVLRPLLAYGSAVATFTWYEPLPEGATRVEVRAVPVLP